MCGGNMVEVVRIISEYVFEDRQIPEDLMYEFSKETAKIVRSGCTEVISEEFWELEHYIEAYWRGRKYMQSDDKARVYQMGQLLSFTNMICMLVEQQEKEVSIDDYAVRFKDRFLVFKGMFECPGITHKELADTAGLSVSSLSQFINKYKCDGFFLSRSMGREKHYYLTEYGEKLYSVMKLKHDRSPSTHSISLEMVIFICLNYLIAQYGNRDIFSINKQVMMSNNHLGNTGRFTQIIGSALSEFLIENTCSVNLVGKNKQTECFDLNSNINKFYYNNGEFFGCSKSLSNNLKKEKWKIPINREEVHTRKCKKNLNMQNKRF